MSMSQAEIEALMKGADDFQEDDNKATETQESEDNIDDILAGIDGITDDEPVSTEDNFDDILAGIDGITDSDDSSQSDNITSVESPKKEAINEDKYPLPVEKEHKVVNQLNEVAEDSEQKASQIFDVLSFVLDENNEIDKYNKQMEEFIKSQVELLESLASKFPNIALFNENLEKANTVLESSSSLSNKVNSENNKIFEAMELMQYHDINRQKIERVMAVIRKLSNYLNGIFEDDSDKPEVQIAKHISGDSSETVNADDIESLISEMSN
ncbi:MAG: hypothetical protein U9O56_04265 [Campylobacterota bacterium]|nr:hypothetical protein [Campylobacterota bacterium]